MSAGKRLTNLQVELLEVFKYELSEEQIKEIKELQLSLYQKPLSLVTLTKIVAKNFGSDLLEGSKSKFNKL